MFKKIDSKIIPVYPEHFKNIIEKIQEGEIFQIEFSKPSKSKSSEQLGYLHVAVYPFILATLVDMGFESLYTEKFYDFSVDVKITTESIDHFFKKMFEKHIQREFQKRNADKDEMREYISFIDRWMIEKIGRPLPEPLKKG